MYVCVFVCVCVCVCVCVYVCNIFLFILSQKFGGFLTTWSPFGKMLRHFSVKGKQWRYVPPWARNDHSTNNKSENPTLRNGNYSILVPFLVELAFLSRKKTNKNPTCWNAIQILCCLLVRKARIFSRKKILKTLPSETPFHIVPSPCWRSSHFFSQKNIEKQSLPKQPFWDSWSIASPRKNRSRPLLVVWSALQQPHLECFYFWIPLTCLKSLFLHVISLTSEKHRYFSTKNTTCMKMVFTPWLPNPNLPRFSVTKTIFY